METVGAVFIDGGKMTDRSIETSPRITFLKHEIYRLVIGIETSPRTVVGEVGTISQIEDWQVLPKSRRFLTYSYPVGNGQV